MPERSIYQNILRWADLNEQEKWDKRKDRDICCSSEPTTAPVCTTMEESGYSTHSRT